MRHRAVDRQAHQIAGKRADTFRTHRIALVGHRARSDLIFAERLLDFLEVGEQTDVTGHFVTALRDPGEYREYKEIHLARVGLSAQGDRRAEAHFLGNEFIQLPDFVMVAVEEFHETGLGAGGAFDPAERDLADLLGDPLQVHHEILQVKREPFAQRGQLRRLIMGETERGQVFVLVRDARQNSHDFQQFGLDQFETVAHLDELGVVGDEAAGGAEVDDRFGFGTLRAEYVDMAHHVVAQFRFFGRGGFEIDVVQMRPHLIELFVGDGQAEFLFGFGQREPQPPPGGMFPLRRPVITHFLAGITASQRVLIHIHIFVHFLLLDFRLTILR